MSDDATRELSCLLAGRPCWVVGGCGLLGSCLLALARRVGMPALGLDTCPGAELQGNAAEASVLAEARSRLEPELIFCCAATHGGDEAAYRATYLDLPRALHEACPSARMVFCSSSSVYGGQGGTLVTEDSPCLAASVRAHLLLEAEAAVRGFGGLIARLVPLYGEGRCELLRRFVQQEPELAGADSRWLNYVHVEDAARALLCLAVRGNMPVANVCAESFTKGEVAAFLSALTGVPRVKQVVAAGRRGVSDQRVSADRLRSLGWEPQMVFRRWAGDHWRQMG